MAAYYGVVTAVTAQRRAVLVQWELRSEAVDEQGAPLEVDLEAFTVPVPQGLSLAATAKAITDRVNAEVRPRVDAANATKSDLDKYFGQLQEMLIGERYPK